MRKNHKLHYNPLVKAKCISKEGKLYKDIPSVTNDYSTSIKPNTNNINKKLFHFLTDTTNEDQNKKMEYATNESLMKTNTIQTGEGKHEKFISNNLIETTATLCENLKLYEILFIKLLAYLKSKITREAYEDFKKFLKEEIQIFYTGSNSIKKEDSYSSIKDLLSNGTRNSRNTKMSGLLNKESISTLQTKSGVETDERKLRKTNDEKNEKPENKMKILKLSFDVSSRDSQGKLKPDFNYKMKSLGRSLIMENFCMNNSKSSPKEARKKIQDLKMSNQHKFSKYIMNQTAGTATVSQISRKKVNPHSRSSLYNLMKVDASPFMNLTSKTQSNSHSKEEMNQVVSSLPCSKSRANMKSKDKSSVEATAMVKINRIKENSNFPRGFLNEKLLRKLNSNTGIASIQNKNNRKKYCGSFITGNKLFWDISKNNNAESTKPKGSSYSAKPGLLSIGPSSYCMKGNKSKQVIVKNIPKKIMDLTYNPRKECQEDTQKQVECDKKRGDMLKEIQQNLDDNLKVMFNFSYEGFLNKETESEGRYSTQKTPDLSYNNDITGCNVAGACIDYKSKDLFQTLKGNEIGNCNEVSYEENEDKLKERMFKFHSKK